MVGGDSVCNIGYQITLLEACTVYVDGLWCGNVVSPPLYFDSYAHCQMIKISANTIHFQLLIQEYLGSLLISKAFESKTVFQIRDQDYFKDSALYITVFFISVSYLLLLCHIVM